MKRTIEIVVLVIGLSAMCFGQEATRADKERLRAERIWEEMVKVKGGREKLHSISNMLWVKETNPKYNLKSIILDVFPYKSWEWKVTRTFPVGPGPELWVIVNLSEANRYWCHANKFVERKDVKENLKCKKAEKDDDDGRLSWLEAPCKYLLETRWMQPRPLRVSRQKFGRETLDVVETLVSYSGQQRRLDFMVDPETLLVRYVIDYYKDKPYEFHAFDRYALVDGIQMPSRWAWLGGYKYLKKKRKRFYYIPLKFRFNVEYNKRLFKQPPSVAAGPDAWKPEEE